MFYLQFENIDDFGTHLKSNAVSEAFVFVTVPANLPTDTEFRDANFTARVNDHIAFCTQLYDYRAKNAAGVRHEYKELEERLTKLGIAVKRGRWTSVPPSILSPEKIV